MTRSPSVLRNAFSLLSIRLVLQQIGLAILVFALYALWLRIPDASAINVIGTVLLALIVLAVAGGGESALILRLADRPRTPARPLRGTLFLLAGVALWFAWSTLLDHLHGERLPSRRLSQLSVPPRPPLLLRLRTPCPVARMDVDLARMDRCGRAGDRRFRGNRKQPTGSIHNKHSAMPYLLDRSRSGGHRRNSPRRIVDWVDPGPRLTHRDRQPDPSPHPRNPSGCDRSVSPPGHPRSMRATDGCALLHTRRHSGRQPAAHR